jgi:23S rRNA pseudouridine1911/1915/1917 synthase
MNLTNKSKGIQFFDDENFNLVLNCYEIVGSRYDYKGFQDLQYLYKLNEMFSNRETQKTYWAVVKNKPPENQDTLVHYLKRNEKNNTSKAHLKEIPESKIARLDYKIIKILDNYFALEINLHTGRHHQIRAQLAAINCPIKGDLKYGFDRSNPDGGIHLHARKLVFIHPVTKNPLQIIAETPKDAIWNSI